jgi:hypothetical protein
MPTVTVDLDDLEKLIFTAGAMKTVEGALKQRREDPFVRDHLEFTDAHNRLAAAVRNVQRGTADTLVAWDGELSQDEIKLLRKVTGELAILTRDQKAGKSGEDMSIADRLAAKGCVIMGQLVKGVLWAGETKPVLVQDTSGFPIKITNRGTDKLAAIDTAATK